ncbi:phosphate acetyltransferase [bacterium]|nr:phosphate acetyltransferase [bacterium]MCB2201703.1 phosphate acetyltransferase [bacterium]
MNAVEKIKEAVRPKKRKVVLPEGTDKRVVQAARKIVDQKLGAVTVLGDPTEIEKLAKESSVDLSGVELINPIDASDFGDFVAELMEIRKKKNLDEASAKKLMSSPLYYGSMMVHKDKADAAVSGSLATTGDVLRAALHCIGLAKGINTVSSSFIMTLPRFGDVENKVFVFGDCAVVPNPTAEQLASIAVSTAETMQKLVGEEPKVAMLSFSTKGSAKHEDVDKVLAALEILKRDHPTLKVDGELQLDAAIMPAVGAKKAPGSEIAGQANVLIFPDLDAGNIGYKLTQRLAGATATGPIIQGLAKPANDLSRGCSVDDIVDVSAIAMLLRG